MRENGRNVSGRRLGRGKVSESKVNGAKVSGKWDRCDKVTWTSWDDGFLWGRDGWITSDAPSCAGQLGGLVREVWSGLRFVNELRLARRLCLDWNDNCFQNGGFRGEDRQISSGARWSGGRSSYDGIFLFFHWFCGLVFYFLFFILAGIGPPWCADLYCVTLFSCGGLGWGSRYFSCC